MITIKPFRGLRPAEGSAEKIVSPPYDVLDSDEARIMAAQQEYSFLHVVKPEIDLPRLIDGHDVRVYAKGVENLKTYIIKNLLIQDERPCFYIYKLQIGDHVQIGLVATASIQDYLDGRIKKHEFTRLDKEEDRANHIDCLNAQTGPVFLIYKYQETITKLLEKGMQKEPDYDFTGQYDVQHTLYVVDDIDLIQEIVEIFKTIDSLYIADGHHRSAAAARVQERRKKYTPDFTGEESFNYYLTVLFADSQLRILDYNRAVKYLNAHSETDLLRAIESKFTVEVYEPGPDDDKQFKPSKLHEFGMYLKGSWYKLTAKPDTFDANDPVEVLDVFILQENLLAPILGIQNPRTDKGIHFVGGIRGLGELERLVNSGGYAVAFALYPTSIAQLMNIADADRVMPPKSTWFEPKLGSGLITHLLE